MLGLETLGGTVVAAVSKVIDDLYDSPEEKRAGQVALLQVGMQIDLAQLKVNAAEAKSLNVFTAGWRPFIGWICGAAFAWKFLILPLINTAAFYAFAYLGVEVDLSGLPVIDTSEMLPILGGMLGLGAFRSYEKSRGIQS